MQPPIDNFAYDPIGDLSPDDLNSVLPHLFFLRL